MRALVIAALIALGSAPAHAAYTPGLTSTTVSALPTCNAAMLGRAYMVTDALVPVALATVVGGGAVVMRVTCNGSAWVVI